MADGAGYGALPGAIGMVRRKGPLSRYPFAASSESGLTNV